MEPRRYRWGEMRAAMTDIRARIARAMSPVRGLRARGAEGRQALQVAVGCAVAFALYHLFNLPQGYWAVFTVVIVMQGSLGGTLTAAFDRMKGTLLGAAVGALAAVARPQTPLGLGIALALSVLITAFIAALRPTYKVAPVTAVIMLISPSGGAIGPVESAGLRVVEIFIGSVVGVLTSLLVFPARSNRLVVARVEAVLRTMATLAEHYAADVVEEGIHPDRHPEHSAIRTALGGVETAMADAARERSTRLSDHRIAEAMPRTLWRVRNDLVAVGRAVGALSHEVRLQLAAGAAEMLVAQAEFMRRCGAALERSAPVDRHGRAGALDAFEAVIERLRRSGATQALGFDAAGPVFALAFAVESLHRNLNDLADRIDETARGKAETRPEL